MSAFIAGCATVAPPPVVEEPAPLPQQNIEMVRALNEMSALKEELKLLRNSIEELQFSQENSQRRQQDLYQDMDRRLTGLERNTEQLQSQLDNNQPAPLTPSQAILAEGQIGAESSSGIASLNPGAAASSDTGLVNVVTVTGTPTTEIPDSKSIDSAVSGTGSVSLNEQDAYDSAFEALKQSRYQDAIEQFRGLVNTWPNSELADDALYWLSEANYVNREFEAALNGFRGVVERYPDSSRVPEAMLKVGYIQYDIGAYDQAATTFEEILLRFPGNQVTVPAETRLRRIKQTIQ